MPLINQKEDIFLKHKGRGIKLLNTRFVTESKPMQILIGCEKAQ
jgi:hypothetical protein